MKAYISGGMRGYPSFQFPTFDAVAGAWKAQGRGFGVNPADHDREVIAHTCGGAPEDYPGFAEGDIALWAEATGFHYQTALGWDTVQVAECEAIVMLPEWERSEGARHERYVAEALGKTVYLSCFGTDGWKFYTDPVQKRMSLSVVPVFTAPTIERGVDHHPVYGESFLHPPHATWKQVL